MRTIPIAIAQFSAGALIAAAIYFRPPLLCSPIVTPVTSSRSTTAPIETSEELQRLFKEWEDDWFLDRPSDQRQQRTHGGVI